MIVANGDDANVRVAARRRARALGHVRLRAATATRSPPTSIERRKATEFTAWWEGKEWSRFRTTLSGRHNVLNALADAAIARLRGVSAEEIQKGLETFQGIKRRMEVRGVERGVTVIDDFAHHPTAIATTLAGARKRYPGPAHLGALRAALDLFGAQGVRERLHRRLPRGRPRDHRPDLSPRALRDALRARQDDVGAETSSSGSTHDGIQAEQIDDFDAIAERVAREAKRGRRGAGDVVGRVRRRAREDPRAADGIRRNSTRPPVPSAQPFTDRGQPCPNRKHTTCCASTTFTSTT